MLNKTLLLINLSPWNSLLPLLSLSYITKPHHIKKPPLILQLLFSTLTFCIHQEVFQKSIWKMTLYPKQYFGAWLSVLKARGLLKKKLISREIYSFSSHSWMSPTLPPLQPYSTNYSHSLFAFFIILSTISLYVYSFFFSKKCHLSGIQQEEDSSFKQHN